MPRSTASGSYDADFVCPGASMDMPALALQKHGQLPENPILGTCIESQVVYATDEKIREKAASGGTVYAVLKHLFEEGRIELAYVADRGASPYDGKGSVLTSVEHFGGAHGSHYHPINFGHALNDLFARDAKSEKGGYQKKSCVLCRVVLRGYQQA